MYISFKKIIHGVDKLIHPQKYYTNNITKNIKNLEKGDTVYVVRIPDIEHMSIITSFSALDEIIMEKCTVDDKLITKEDKTTAIDLRIYAKNPTYKLISGLNYYGITNENNHHTRDYIIRFYFNTKDVYNSFMLKSVYGNTLVTTDKNAIIKHINQMANTIKNRLYERLEAQEENPYNFVCDYTAVLRNFKKQYANLRNQVRML